MGLFKKTTSLTSILFVTSLVAFLCLFGIPALAKLGWQINGPMLGKKMGTLDAKIDIRNSEYVFKKASGNCYEIENLSYNLAVSTEGGGHMQYRDFVLNRVENRVPGRDFIGSAQICVGSVSDRVVLTYSLKINDFINKIDKFKVEFQDQIQMQAPISPAQRQQMAMGETVVVQPDVESQNAYVGSHFRQMNEFICNKIKATVREVIKVPTYCRSKNNVEQIQGMFNIEISPETLKLKIDRYWSGSMHQLNLEF